MISGAARRLGAATALALAERGSIIILHYNSSEREAMRTAAKIEESGPSPYLVQQDLSDPEGARKLFEKLNELGASPQILINSAGIYPPSDFGSLEWYQAEQVFRLNSFAPFALSREFADLPGAESIVNVLDARMVDYDRQHLAYHLSKRLLQDLTRILSFELAPEIRVNGIAPGIILPESDMSAEVIEKYRKGNLLQRIGTPEEYLQTILFLLSNEFITGQIIFVDGGRHIRGRFYGN